jgi:hypothetical protein
VSGDIAPPFLTSALDGGEWSISLPCRFIPADTGPCTRRVGGWMGHTAGLDVMEKKEILSLLEIEPCLLGHPARSLIAILT